jgi:transposase
MVCRVEAPALECGGQWRAGAPIASRELRRRAAQYTPPYREVGPGQDVLLAAEGLENAEIARRLDTTREVVSRWRKRFHEERLAGLEESQRPGRPRSFLPRAVAEVKALACGLPAERGLPLARLSCSEIAREAIAAGIVEEVSGVTVWRWLSEDALRPWRYSSWIFPRDPGFREKAGRVLNLYEGRYEGRRLRPGEFVICADEKLSTQARARIRPSLAPAAGAPRRVEHEYERRGALCYLAAWDVRRGEDLRPLRARAGHRALRPPRRTDHGRRALRLGRRVFWVVDNGSAHRGQRARDCPGPSGATSSWSTCRSTAGG